MSHCRNSPCTAADPKKTIQEISTPESATFNWPYDTGSEKLDYTIYENCGYVAHEKIVFYPSHLKKLKYSAAGLASAWIEHIGWVYVTRGGIVIPTVTYENGPDYFQEGMARYRENNRIGFINEKGEVVIPAQFGWAFPFEDGVAVFCEGATLVKDGEYTLLEGGRWGAIDRTGKIIIPVTHTPQEIYKELTRVRGK